MHEIHGATIKSNSYARNKQAPLVDMRGVHREPHDHGTYSSGLDEERSIKELKLQTRPMTFLSFFFQKYVLVRNDIVDDF